jgi:hypothetical protein
VQDFQPASETGNTEAARTIWKSFSPAAKRRAVRRLSFKENSQEALRVIRKAGVQVHSQRKRLQSRSSRPHRVTPLERKVLDFAFRSDISREIPDSKVGWFKAKDGQLKQRRHRYTTLKLLYQQFRSENTGTCVGYSHTNCGGNRGSDGT